MMSDGWSVVSGEKPVSKSILFEEFLNSNGYPYKYSTAMRYPSYSVTVNPIEGESFKCNCATQEVGYFAGELRRSEIDWSCVADKDRLKAIVASGGELLVIGSIPKVLSYLGSSMYQRFVCWRMENAR